MWPVLIQPVYCSGSNTAKLIAAVVVTSQIIHTHTHRRGAGAAGVRSSRSTDSAVPSWDKLCINIHETLPPPDVPRQPALTRASAGPVMRKNNC